MGTTAFVTSTVLAGAMGVGSSIASGRARAKQADAEKQAAETNALLAQLEAKKIMAEHALAATGVRDTLRGSVAAYRAANTNNIGSSADAVIMDSYFNAEKDLAALKFNYDNRAINALNQAGEYKFQAKVARENRSSAILGSYLNAGAAAAGTVSSLANNGIFGPIGNNKES